MRIVFVALFLLSSIYVSGQELGLRFGEVSGNNVAIDGMFDVNGKRIHANLSFGDGMGLDALWHFVNKPIGEESFNWYAGAGVSTFIGDDFLLGASGEIGIEYYFNSVPIVIGFDYRPTFWIVEETDWEWGGFGLNVRYRFN